MCAGTVVLARRLYVVDFMKKRFSPLPTLLRFAFRRPWTWFTPSLVSLYVLRIQIGSSLGRSYSSVLFCEKVNCICCVEEECNLVRRCAWGEGGVYGRAGRSLSHTLFCCLSTARTV